jgi:3-oxocholest-4-en-26-oate---CoA ligase
VTNWNYADVWETTADVLPEALATVQGARRVRWAEFDRRSDGVASWLLSLGTSHQDKVALYLYNCSEYLEGIFGSTKVGLVPVNTNYRYVDDELAYLWDNADAVAVVFHGSFAERAERVRPRVPRVRGWLWVDDGSGPCPDWAVPYEEVAKLATARVRAPWGRSGDDLVMLYTGGTTGMPKGVMWRQDDLFAQLNGAGFRRYSEEDGLDGIRRDLTEHGAGNSLMPACPLMHGTGGFTACECLAEAGRVVLLPSRHYQAIEMLDTIEKESVNGLVIVGDAFARPMLEALDADPEHWDLSSLLTIISSGAMWSEEIKEGLLRHHPNMVLIDAFASSEALGMGISVSSGDSAAKTAQFSLGPDVRVLAADGRPVQPGSDEIGVLALGGRNPLGYYKDPDKSASTFKVVDGVRYSIPGDYAKVNADGSIHLLGRGSVVINTAGEKVYPEEVEEALKTSPEVDDAVVVGVPDERYGEQIAAVVEPARDAHIDTDQLTEHVKSLLAGFKVPRYVRVVDTIGRSPNGKVDYRRHKAETEAWLTAGGAR